MKHIRGQGLIKVPFS